jgi:hypothetical protein
MNATGISRFNQARIEWAIRLKYSPLPALDMDRLAGQLNDFRIGELRVIGKTWEVMLERDAELAVNSDKRKADAASLDWQVVSDGSLTGDQHAEALTYLYNNVNATHALDQDSAGGTSQLIYQVLSALDNYYSAHEMLLRVDNPAAREITFEFRHTPIWFLEARRGYLGYLQHIFDLYGQPCRAGEWLTAVNSGWMRSLCLIYALKAFALRDWSIFNARYGSGFLDGATSAEPGSAEWNNALTAMQTMANDAACLHNDSVVFKFLEQAGRNALPFEPLVKWANELYAKCYRGIDLATSSRGGAGGAGSHPGAGQPVGASIQKEESGIFLARDAHWVTGVFNERIDRPAIRYLFGQEPRAWFALLPPAGDNAAQMLAAVQTLVPMGLRLALKDVYQAFRFKVPVAGDLCLTPPAGAAPEAPGTNLQAPAKLQAPTDKPIPAQTSDDSTIAPGADPRFNPSLLAGIPGSAPAPGADERAPREQFTVGAPGMPDPQVDAGSFWSRAGLMPRGADGQTLPAPSLGYALPNDRHDAGTAGEKLEQLLSVGLGNSRAARALQRERARHAVAAAEKI